METEVKTQIKLSLMEEQGYLCAYCMKRINKPEDTKLRIIYQEILMVLQIKS